MWGSGSSAVTANTFNAGYWNVTIDSTTWQESSNDCVITIPAKVDKRPHTCSPEEWLDDELKRVMVEL